MVRGITRHTTPLASSPSSSSDSPSDSSPLKFIVGYDPSKLRATKSIRSHAARYGWKGHAARRLPPRKRRTLPDKRDAGSGSHSPEVPDESTLHIDYLLGGGRVDPFHSHPGEPRPFVSYLLDHYLVHMAVDVEELDGPEHKGLLRTRWYPLVLSELALFQAIILLAASNVSSLSYTSDLGYRVMQLRSDAMRSINNAFSDDGHDGRKTADAVIGAVAKMASFEAMHGDRESFCVHMRGVRQMVDLRGGLRALGLGGLLRRIVVWIDINGSFLTQAPRFFPGETFDDAVEPNLPEPNPEKFVAA